MQKINFNFNQLPNQPSKLAGWLLLVIGVALLLEMGLSYNRLQNERAKLDKEIKTSRLQLDMTREEPSHQQFTEKDVEEARQIFNRLSAPWESFIVGLESIRSNKVAILSIEPDTQTGILRIEGEAKDYPAVLTFVSHLRTTKPFSKVFLVHHEFKRDDPQHPVAFTVSMHWVKAS